MSKRFISEIIGTFALVFCGTGAMVINDFTGGTVTHVGVAITFGLIVMGMIYAFGDISGAHMNPAVTIGFAYAKKFPWKEVPAYVLAQLIGAFLASGILLYLFPESQTLGATLPGLSALKVFILEIILSFFLMVVIINVSTGSKEIGVVAGIAIGSIVLLEAMFAGPITGASMNPARSIAPAVVSGNIADLWIYIFAPIIGCVLAVVSCKLVKDEQCCDENC
ncbi:MIP family channel protein [Flavobacteriaceae bacterium]|jgi:aquaporin Z|nr:MIP family channel protein [Flavobacteriaceae bacterium]MDA9309104.1 MIP family channel protein [Flavobacteriaceae bacterium]MDB4203715.1 MIP family channel protein [Flavobacteriaceae bacterium]MDC0342539.1 MIP family channel protein [Flavobacteriaceae bacterium]MDC1199488.1 MIP family channel protein [Flavobacteriaceae bacterium]